MTARQRWARSVSGSLVMLDRVLVEVDELGEDATECVEVSLCEGIDEVVLDAFFVWWPYQFEPRSTLASEGDVETPSVVRVEVPANQPRRVPFDQACG